MEYSVITNVREDARLRDSFNKLTQRTFCFDFVNWYESGFWGEHYIPHVLLDGEQVVSNISVNLMKFDDCGQTRNYIQLGTVMTDPAYRKQGLNRIIMESILDEYRQKVDGIYLFANDSVLNYYPKYGFTPITEYEYSFILERDNQFMTDQKYRIEKLDLSRKETEEKLYQDIREIEFYNLGHNPNEDLAMYDNLGLYQFWLADEYCDNVFFLPEFDSYVIAIIESDTLQIIQIISKYKIDMHILGRSFGENVTRIKLNFTPSTKDKMEVRTHKKEDCTLFVMGESLKQVEIGKMMFPVISHA